MNVFALTVDGFLAPDKIAKILFTDRADLAWTAGLPSVSLRRQALIRKTDTQQRLRELVEVLSKVTPCCGSPHVAYGWMRSQSLSEFGGRTAMHLIHEGRAADLMNYLDAAGTEALG